MLHDSRAKFVRVLTFFSFIHYEDDHARKPDDEKKKRLYLSNPLYRRKLNTDTKY